MCGYSSHESITRLSANPVVSKRNPSFILTIYSLGAFLFFTSSHLVSFCLSVYLSLSLHTAFSTVARIVPLYSLVLNKWCLNLITLESIIHRWLVRILNHSVVSDSLRPVDCRTSLHEMLQARILEWVANASSRGPSRSRDWTRVSCVSYIGRKIIKEPPGKSRLQPKNNTYIKSSQTRNLVFCILLPSTEIYDAEKW